MTPWRTPRKKLDLSPSLSGSFQSTQHENMIHFFPVSLHHIPRNILVIITCSTNLNTMYMFEQGHWSTEDKAPQLRRRILAIRAETQSKTIAGHGGPIDPWRSHRWSCRWPMTLFLLAVTGPAMIRDGIVILVTVRLLLLGLFLHDFNNTNFAKYNLQFIGITQSLIFLKISIH